MLRLRAFRGTNDKIVKMAVHPTHPWLVTADASDYVSVWNWEHRQIIYELKAGGVDRRRLVGAKLEKLAEGDASKGKHAEAIRGGSVKQVSFFDDDVRYWQYWRNHSAAAEAPSATNNFDSAFRPSSIRGQHYLVVCCENKAIFLDLVTMRGRDVPKFELDNKSLLCMEFLPWLATADSPLVAFGGSDGVIRTLSMMTWKLAARCMGGHKGSISCMMTFLTSSGEALLISGGSDGLLIIWNALETHHGHGVRDLVAKLSMKAHDGGVVAIELNRVIGGSPQLITIGADKTLVIWDTNKFKELRRLKPVPKLACHSVASWRHPRAPNLDILTCVKDSYIWAIEHPTFSALTRPLCDLYSLIPPLLVATHKKLRVYCMVAHPLQPHLVATGTNVGVIVSEFDPGSLPPVTPLLMSAESRNLSAVCILAKELKLLNFHLSNTTDPSLGNNSSLSETENLKGDPLEPLHVTQTRKRINAPVPHDSYSVLSVSSTGKYVAIVWPDIPYFSIYNVSNWSIVDSGSARLLAWDTCCDRFAILESTLPPRMPIIPKGSSSRKAKEAAAAAAQAAAAAAANSASANVQVRILLDDGTSNILMRSIGSRNEPVVGLYGGALFGIAYRTSRRATLGSATTISTIQSMSVSGFCSYDDGFSSQRSTAEAATQNFQFFSWETCQPVGSFLPQPEWTAWDQTVEYCALAYQRYIVISTLRPQYRYLGDVAISHATGAVWQRRQLFVATPTTIECVFVDAGVAPVDIETRKRKEEMKLREAQARALAGHGELALINVDGPQTAKEEKITLRPPMLQVVRLASFQHAPSVLHFLSLPKQFKVGGDDMEERKVNEIAVGGGGVSVAVTRFPTEQKRPVGPVIVVGVRDGVLWLIDRYMTVHALSLSHPGIRCRCLAAYGDAVSAVKWAIRLAREHHDDLAQFLLGMGYANEALHLPGISKRLEFDLAMKSNDLKRALQCLLKMSNSRDMGQDNPVLDKNDILNLTAKKENLVEAVQGIVKFAKEFLDLIDAADATAQVDIAREALKRLATAGSVKGALPGHELRGLALRLANHGELTRLSGLGTNLISLGLGREAAFAAALLGDNSHMEKAWQDTGMLAEAVLHAHAHGRSTLKNLVEAWNKVLQKEVDHIPTAKTDATAAFLAALEPKLSSLSESGKKPPIEIFPPGMSALSSSIVIKKNPAPATQTSQQQSSTPLAIEGPRPSGPIGAPIGAPPPSASAAVPGTPIGAPTPSAPAATQGTPIGAPSPGATAATSGMPIGAPPPGTAAATPGTPVGAPPPDTPTATPGMAIRAPPPGIPAATPGMAIGAPAPGTSAGTPGMPIGAPPPSTSVATPDIPIGATPPSAAAAAPGTPIEAPPPGAQAETSATPSRGPPTDASAATPGMVTGAPPPAAKKGTTTGASPPAETSGMTTRAPTPDAPDATPDKPIEAPPPGAPAARPGTPIGSPPPAAPAATTGTPVGAPPTSAPAGKQSTPTEAPCPSAPDARQGSPIGAPAATPGMSIGAPAATSGTPIAASTPGAPAATPSTSIGTPPPGAPAATPSTPIGAPPPNAPVATLGKPIGAPPPGALAVASGTPIGSTPHGAQDATPHTSIGAPPPDASTATTGKAIGAPPPGAPAAAATGAPPPISGASEPGSDDKAAISSSGNQHTTASVESNPTKSTNGKPADATPTDKPLADVPSLTPDNQETSVPTTDPTSEPLA